MKNYKRRKASKKDNKEQKLIKQQLRQLKGGAGATEYIIL